MQSHTTIRRVAALVFAGLAWFAAIMSYQYARGIEPAPPEAQNSGLAIIHECMIALENNGYHHTPRGRIIMTEIRKLLAENRIVFAPMTKTRGLTFDPFFGRKTIYIKIIAMNHGRFLHQRPPEIIEALVHETIHSVKNTRRRMSIEEECDCFAAGLEAALTTQGKPIPDIFAIDGKPIVDFILASYTNTRRDPTYQPVGISREWLLSHAGITQETKQ